ncbi:MAG: hypothetical protein K2H86_06045 [Muribaculaceae bacterium]|nr:hypothetical protein [Muribaculaceae bacterium]
MNVYLDLEPYLRQWFQYFCGCDSTPLVLPKGCPEAKLLRVFLRAPREGEEVLPPEDHDFTPVRIPHFSGHDVYSANYLPKRGHDVLKSMIRDRFDLDLWQSLCTVPLRGEYRKDAVQAWMDARGIEDTMTNYETVIKRFQKLLNRHRSNVCMRRMRANRRVKAAETAEETDDNK